ncbi:hypothetical protein P3597_21840, partial [Vibrio parahaemolyticus]|nr:hypothetical protein [Vibrio parahaemolyticus]MDF5087947.1 hypothetical protein [Vibrio parahaemolyticus]MDF5408665.1 hypothetical protein [Vibrio parahaemolyticus]MDG2824098.1 hypothetical protein [Vibrio parahaemolyticus]MDG2859786.1 hypothetical protein [Vibrio parahaemolyticus]
MLPPFLSTTLVEVNVAVENLPASIKSALLRISVIAIARFRYFSSKLSSFLQFSNVNDYAAHFSGFK